ncbi:MAG: hypothetical protein CMJ63_01565, partial [Planctomycetaceae bacterium]|nr:hypothetical protein [Planctomycetaceae bacterium]
MQIRQSQGDLERGQTPFEGALKGLMQMVVPRRCLSPYTKAGSRLLDSRLPIPVAAKPQNSGPVLEHDQQIA